MSVFLFGRKANLVLLTLFYSTILALTDRRTDRETNTLASRGLEEPAHALRGLEEPFSRQNQKLTQHTAQLEKRFLQPT